VSGWYQAAQRTMPSLAAQVDEAYARSRTARPDIWSGIERRRGADASYRGDERRHGHA